jgi:hypothetical protein
VRGGEGELLDLCEIVLGVSVESHSSDLVEGIGSVWPDLGE